MRIKTSVADKSELLGKVIDHMVATKSPEVIEAIAQILSESINSRLG